MRPPLQPTISSEGLIDAHTEVDAQITVELREAREVPSARLSEKSFLVS